MIRASQHYSRGRLPMISRTGLWRFAAGPSIPPDPHRGHAEAVLLRAAVSLYQAVASARCVDWRGRFKALRGYGARIDSLGPRSA